MPRFLFQPYSIDGYEFNPIPIDIHLGILKIPTEEILDDFGINTTESVIVGTDRLEVTNRMQSAFAREFEHYGKIKESGIRPMDYKIIQAWIRIRKHIKKLQINNKEAISDGPCQIPISIKYYELTYYTIHLMLKKKKLLG